MWLAVVVLAVSAAAAPRGPRAVALGRLRGGTSDADAMLTKLREADGFVAALDQSGGSTPAALAAYGVEEFADVGDMYDLAHAMRERTVRSAAFSGARILACILFEMTMDREFCGVPAPRYLWETKGVVPLLKIDKGLEDAADGVMLMRPVDDLEATLARAKALGVRGTKARSRILAADAAGVEAVVAQQFALAKRVVACGLVPILEPEVDLGCADKAAAEELLLNALHEALHGLGPDDRVPRVRVLFFFFSRESSVRAFCPPGASPLRRVCITRSETRQTPSLWGGPGHRPPPPLLCASTSVRSC